MWGVPSSLAHQRHHINACSVALRQPQVGFLGLPLSLEPDEIERRCLVSKARQHAVNLAAMVGLVIEEMEKRRYERLLHRHRIRNWRVAEPSPHRFLAQSFGESQYPRVLRLARIAKLGERFQRELCRDSWELPLRS